MTYTHEYMVIYVDCYSGNNDYVYNFYQSYFLIRISLITKLHAKSLQWIKGILCTDWNPLQCISYFHLIWLGLCKQIIQNLLCSYCLTCKVQGHKLYQTRIIHLNEYNTYSTSKRFYCFCATDCKRKWYSWCFWHWICTLVIHNIIDVLSWH